MALNHLHL